MENEITLIIHASHNRENCNCEEIRLNLTFKPSNGQAEPPDVDSGLDNFIIIIFPIYLLYSYRFDPAQLITRRRIQKKKKKGRRAGASCRNFSGG